METFTESESTAMNTAVASRLNAALGTEISHVQVEKRFAYLRGSVGAVVRMQEEDAKLVMSKKRRILGSSDLLSIARDLPREERARLFEKRQKNRARADTATARAVGMSPSPASQDAAAGSSQEGQPEEGELLDRVLPPPVPPHAGTAPAQREPSKKDKRNAGCRSQASQAADLDAAADTRQAPDTPQPTPEASTEPPPCCVEAVTASSTAASHHLSEQPAGPAACGEAGEGDTPAKVPLHGTSSSGVAVAVADEAPDTGTVADTDTDDHAGACSSSE